MTSHSTGPQLNTEKSRGDREWFSNLPQGQEPDYIIDMYDFTRPSELDTTNDFTEVNDASTSVAIATDADGGAIVMSSQATTDDSGTSIQEVQQTRSLSSGKRAWFKARFKSSDADQQQIFVGLSVAFATNPEAVLSAADRIGFQVDDGNASIICKSEKNSTESSTDSGVDLADDTYVTVGFYWDGSSTAKFFVNDALVATHTSNNPDDVQLGVALFQLSGDDSGTKSMTVDYAYVAQER